MKRSGYTELPDAVRHHLICVPKASITLARWRGPLVPSPYGADCNQSFRFTLVGESTRLRTVVLGPKKLPLTVDESEITEYTDFFCPPPLEHCTLESRFTSEDPDACGPAFFIARRRSIASRRVAHSDFVNLPVPEVSQMPFEQNPYSHRRLCMPTCMFMVSQFLGVDTTFERVRSLCFNPATNTYGVWPHNIAAFNCLGLTGATILVNHFSDVADLLSSGIPIVASLRFTEGEIPDFPFRFSKGHMVVVRGFSGEELIVNDPAHYGMVQRRYPKDMFMNVWMKGRPEIGCALGVVLWKSGTPQ